MAACPRDRLSIPKSGYVSINTGANRRRVFTNGSYNQRSTDRTRNPLVRRRELMSASSPSPPRAGWPLGDKQASGRPAGLLFPIEPVACQLSRQNRQCLCVFFFWERHSPILGDVWRSSMAAPRAASPATFEIRLPESTGFVISGFFIFAAKVKNLADAELSKRVGAFATQDLGHGLCRAGLRPDEAREKTFENCNGTPTISQRPRRHRPLTYGK